ncbi:hypothetical protein RCL1_005677 [Eukaryota sp. TZLM3-RCL]
MNQLRQLFSLRPDTQVVDLSDQGVLDISSLLPELAKFSQMSHLILARNKLSSLPRNLSSLKRLRTLDMSNNPISNVSYVLPGLETLPKLRHLFITLPNEEQEDEIIITLTKLRTFNGVHLPEAEESAEEQEDEPILYEYPEEPLDQNTFPSVPETSQEIMNDYDLPTLADVFAKLCHVKGASSSPFAKDEVFEKHCSEVFRKNAERVEKVNQSQAQDAIFELSKYELFSILFDPLLHALKYSNSELYSVFSIIIDRMNHVCNSSLSVLTTIIPDLLNKFNEAKDQLLSAERESTDLLHAAELLEQESKTHIAERQAAMTQFEKEKRLLREELGLLKNENEKLNIRVRQLSNLTARLGHSTGKETPILSQVVGVQNESSPTNQKSLTTRDSGNSQEKSVDDLSNAKAALNCLVGDQTFSTKLQSIKHRDLTLKQTLEMIEEIWESKSKSDRRNQSSNLPLETMAEHIFSFLNTKYGLSSLVMEMSLALTSAIKKYNSDDNSVAVFMNVLRSEVDEDFRFVQIQLRKTVFELLKAQIRSKNPYISERDLVAKTNKKSKSILTEEEWVDIVSYLYAHDDAVSVTMKIKLEIQKTTPRPKPLSPATRMRLLQLQTAGKTVDEETRVSLNPSEANRISFQKLIKVLLDFQLEGHVKFLSPFVKLFRKVDSDLDGALIESELAELMKLLDENRTQLEITSAINQIDPNGCGRLTFSQIVSFLSNDLLNMTR